MNDFFPLQGWCIIHVPMHSEYPVMVSNIVDRELACEMAAGMMATGKSSIILAILSAEELRKKLRIGPCDA